eukprot:scpid34945/ scgid32584/ 
MATGSYVALRLNCKLGKLSSPAWSGRGVLVRRFSEEVNSRDASLPPDSKPAGDVAEEKPAEQWPTLNTPTPDQGTAVPYQPGNRDNFAASPRRRGLPAQRVKAQQQQHQQQQRQQQQRQQQQQQQQNVQQSGRQQRSQGRSREEQQQWQKAAQLHQDLSRYQLHPPAPANVSRPADTSSAAAALRGNHIQPRSNTGNYTTPSSNMAAGRQPVAGGRFAALRSRRPNHGVLPSKTAVSGVLPGQYANFASPRAHVVQELESKKESTPQDGAVAIATGSEQSLRAADLFLNIDSLGLASSRDVHRADSTGSDTAKSEVSSSSAAAVAVVSDGELCTDWPAEYTQLLYPLEEKDASSAAGGGGDATAGQVDADAALSRLTKGAGLPKLLSTLRALPVPLVPAVHTVLSAIQEKITMTVSHLESANAIPSPGVNPRSHASSSSSSGGRSTASLSASSTSGDGGGGGLQLDSLMAGLLCEESTSDGGGHRQVNTLAGGDGGLLTDVKDGTVDDAATAALQQQHLDQVMSGGDGNAASSLSSTLYTVDDALHTAECLYGNNGGTAEAVARLHGDHPLHVVMARWLIWTCRQHGDRENTGNHTTTTTRGSGAGEEGESSSPHVRSLFLLARLLRSTPLPADVVRLSLAEIKERIDVCMCDSSLQRELFLALSSLAGDEPMARELIEEIDSKLAHSVSQRTKSTAAWSGTGMVDLFQTAEHGQPSAAPSAPMPPADTAPRRRAARTAAPERDQPDAWESLAGAISLPPSADSSAIAKNKKQLKNRRARAKAPARHQSDAWESLAGAIPPPSGGSSTRKNAEKNHRRPDRQWSSPGPQPHNYNTGHQLMQPPSAPIRRYYTVTSLAASSTARISVGSTALRSRSPASGNHTSALRIPQQQRTLSSTCFASQSAAGAVASTPELLPPLDQHSTPASSADSSSASATWMLLSIAELAAWPSPANCSQLLNFFSDGAASGGHAASEHAGSVDAAGSAADAAASDYGHYRALFATARRKLEDAGVPMLDQLHTLSAMCQHGHLHRSTADMCDFITSLNNDVKLSVADSVDFLRGVLTGRRAKGKQAVVSALFSRHAADPSAQLSLLCALTTASRHGDDIVCSDTIMSSALSPSAVGNLLQQVSIVLRCARGAGSGGSGGNIRVAERILAVLRLRRGYHSSAKACHANDLERVFATIVSCQRRHGCLHLPASLLTDFLALFGADRASRFGGNLHLMSSAVVLTRAIGERLSELTASPHHLAQVVGFAEIAVHFAEDVDEVVRRVLAPLLLPLADVPLTLRQAEPLAALLCEASLPPLVSACERVVAGNGLVSISPMHNDDDDDSFEHRRDEADTACTQLFEWLSVHLASADPSSLTLSHALHITWAFAVVARMPPPDVYRRRFDAITLAPSAEHRKKMDTRLRLMFGQVCSTAVSNPALGLSVPEHVGRAVADLYEETVCASLSRPYASELSQHVKYEETSLVARVPALGTSSSSSAAGAACGTAGGVRVLALDTTLWNTLLSRPTSLAHHVVHSLTAADEQVADQIASAAMTVSGSDTTTTVCDDRGTMTSSGSDATMTVSDVRGTMTSSGSNATTTVCDDRGTMMSASSDVSTMASDDDAVPISSNDDTATTASLKDDAPITPPPSSSPLPLVLVSLANAGPKETLQTILAACRA